MARYWPEPRHPFSSCLPINMSRGLSSNVTRSLARARKEDARKSRTSNPRARHTGWMALSQSWAASCCRPETKDGWGWHVHFTEDMGRLGSLSDVQKTLAIVGAIMSTRAGPVIPAATLESRTSAELSRIRETPRYRCEPYEVIDAVSTTCGDRIRSGASAVTA